MAVANLLESITSTRHECLVDSTEFLWNEGDKRRSELFEPW
jgi:hypothetical protein